MESLSDPRFGINLAVFLQAAILQQTAEYIYQLEQEKTRLLSQNCQLKRAINVSEGESTSTAAKKRKVDAGVVCVNESSADEGIGSMSPEPVDVSDQSPEALRKEMIELRMQLDRERRLRLQLEEQVRSLEAQLYPERIREITQQVQLQYQQVLPDGMDSSESGGENCDKLDAIPQTVEEEFLQVSPPPSPSAPTIVAIEDPLHDNLQDRLPSVLEAAIKAEPKVEVEPAPRIPTPTSAGVDDGVQTRLYAPSTSRQNLETIVEAIRHLEGDHLFSDEPPQQQEMPLALTTAASRMLKVEVSPMDLGYRPASTTVLRTSGQIILPASALLTSNAQQQQQRPGVIVVKHT
ncbi:hypothetical protein B566_EDAN011730 [Ephemera danica]|nr:hypothetical protein B566_EDAN011730 [Ephemera danica]